MNTPGNSIATEEDIVDTVRQIIEAGELELAEMIIDRSRQTVGPDFIIVMERDVFNAKQRDLPEWVDVYEASLDARKDD